LSIEEAIAARVGECQRQPGPGGQMLRISRRKLYATIDKYGLNLNGV